MSCSAKLFGFLKYLNCIFLSSAVRNTSPSPLCGSKACVFAVRVEAQSLSQIHHERPVKPLDEAVFWYFWCYLANTIESFGSFKASVCKLTLQVIIQWFSFVVHALIKLTSEILECHVLRETSFRWTQLTAFVRLPLIGGGDGFCPLL